MTELFLIYIIYIGALISPGPDFIIVMRNTLGTSTRAGIFTAMGVATGQAVHIIYSLAGIGIIISQSIILFNIIKWLGAGYLMYIGYKALRSKGFNTKELQKNAISKTTKTFKKAYTNGFIANILNPKATLFFVALFSQMIDPTLSLNAQFIFGMVCIVTAFFWFTIISVTMGSSPIRKIYTKTSIYIDKIFGAVFIALGLKIALSKG